MLDPVAQYMASFPEWTGLTELGLAYPYTASVVGLTLLLRSFVSIPLTIWQRSRNDRLSRLVLPEWQVWQQQIPAAAWQRRLGAGPPSPQEERQVGREIQKNLAQKWRHLMALYKCSPMKTTLLSLAVHVPLFIVVTMLLRQTALLPGSPLVHELVPWWSPDADFVSQSAATRQVLLDKGMDPALAARLTEVGGPTLADHDPTQVMPVVCGSLNMVNVELASWTRLRRAATDTSLGLAMQPEGEEEPRRARIVTNMMRVGAIASVPIACQVPSVLLVYWCTSSVVTMAQNVYFAWREARVPT